MELYLGGLTLPILVFIFVSAMTFASSVYMCTGDK